MVGGDKAAFFFFKCASQNMTAAGVCYVMQCYTKCSVERRLTFSRGEDNETVRAIENENDRKREIVSSPLRVQRESRSG